MVTMTSTLPLKPTGLIEGVGNEVLIGIAAFVGLLVPVLAYVLSRFVCSQTQINKRRPTGVGVNWYHSAFFILQLLLMKDFEIKLYGCSMDIPGHCYMCLFIQLVSLVFLVKV